MIEEYSTVVTVPAVVRYRSAVGDFPFVIGKINALAQYLSNLDFLIQNHNTFQFVIDKESVFFHIIHAKDPYKNHIVIHAVEGEGYYNDLPIYGVIVHSVFLYLENLEELINPFDLFPPQAYKLGDELVQYIAENHSKRRKFEKQNMHQLFI